MSCRAQSRCQLTSEVLAPGRIRDCQADLIGKADDVVTKSRICELTCAGDLGRRHGEERERKEAQNVDY